MLQEALMHADQRVAAAEATAHKLEAENIAHTTRYDPQLATYKQHLNNTESVQWPRSLLLFSRNIATCKSMHKSSRC